MSLTDFNGLNDKDEEISLLSSAVGQSSPEITQGVSTYYGTFESMLGNIGGSGATSGGQGSMPGGATSLTSQDTVARPADTHYILDTLLSDVTLISGLAPPMEPVRCFPKQVCLPYEEFSPNDVSCVNSELLEFGPDLINLPHMGTSSENKMEYSAVGTGELSMGLNQATDDGMALSDVFSEPRPHTTSANAQKCVLSINHAAKAVDHKISQNHDYAFNAFTPTDAASNYSKISHTVPSYSTQPVGNMPQLLCDMGSGICKGLRPITKKQSEYYAPASGVLNSVSQVVGSVSAPTPLQIDRSGSSDPNTPTTIPGIRPTHHNQLLSQ